MNASPRSSTLASAPPASAERFAVLETDPDVQALLDAFEDPDCRRITEAVGDGALSAREVSTACDLPLSTTYRKLDRLTDGGVLAERTRIHPAGKHASEFVRLVDDVLLTVGADQGLEVRVASRTPIDRYTVASEPVNARRPATARVRRRR